MATVYVVEGGEYSGRYIVGVYDDKALAERAAHVYDGEVQEHELNEGADHLRSGVACWEVLLTMEGMPYTAKLAGLELPDNPLPHMGDLHWQYQMSGQTTARAFDRVIVDTQIYVIARDEAHAIKVAQDKRAAYLATKAGVT